MVAPNKKTVLVVDDEALFLRTIADGFRAHAERVQVLTAGNGRIAMELLERQPVDLVVTDLKMPEADGFELLAYLSRRHPSTPTIVMTAFGTPEIQKRLTQLGTGRYLDKPMTFPQVAERVFEALSASASGHVQGITLPTFLQMMAMERKSCTLHIAASGKTAVLHFSRGELEHAECGELAGDPAALTVVGWEQVQIEIAAPQPHRQSVTMPLSEVLLEGFRRKDEAGRPMPDKSGSESAGDYLEIRSPRSPAAPPSAPPVKSPEPPSNPVVSTQRKGDLMSAQDKLKELSGLDGFGGVAVFTPTGEALASQSGEITNLKEVGVLANNVLLNAQKASLEMGTGRGQQVHIECQGAHILVRCLNEGTDPIRSQPGKAHIHMVLALKSDASIGLAKMRLNAAIEKVADDFRI